MVAAIVIASAGTSAQDGPLDEFDEERPERVIEDTSVIRFDVLRARGRDYKITDSLWFDAGLEVEGGTEIDFDLDRSTDEDESGFAQRLSWSLTYEPSPMLLAYAKMQLANTTTFEHADVDSNDPGFRAREAYLALRNAAPGFSIVAGRTDFEDEREWLWDEEMDGLRLFYARGAIGFEAAAVREEAFHDDFLREHDTEGADNAYLRGYWAFRDDNLANAFALFRNGRDDDNEDVLYLGGGAQGELSDRFEYWLEAAYVVGESAERRIQGVGFDLGGTYIFEDAPLRPSTTLGFAFGSGDNGEGLDTAFRQTGLQDNNDRFAGTTSFKYYGEVLDPELSNLAIFTAAGGIRPTRRTSIELVYHKYWQHHASDELRNISISADPTGLNRDIGDELDIIIGIDELENINLELIGGAFFPGKAFDEKDTAFLAAFKITVGL